MTLGSERLPVVCCAALFVSGNKMLFVGDLFRLVRASNVFGMAHCRILHICKPVSSQPIWLLFRGGSSTFVLALGGVQLPLPVLQWSSQTERT